MRRRSAALINRPDNNASQKHPTAEAAMEPLRCGMRMAYKAVHEPTDVSTPTYRKNRVPNNNREKERQLAAERVSSSGERENPLRSTAPPQTNTPPPTPPTPDRT